MNASLTFPFATPPGPGEVIEVAPGILWVRIPLPFRLDHVNVYLIEDEGGWAIFDTGIDSPQARECWETLLDGPLSGFRFTKVIVSHYHPDHIGFAGSLYRRFGIPLVTGMVAYLTCTNIIKTSPEEKSEGYRQFYESHGVPHETAILASTRGESYKQMVAALPPTFFRLIAGEVLKLGKRDFRILVGDGHATEQFMLFDPADKLLLAADQIIEKITPNISVAPYEPNGDPLGLFLKSLNALADDLPAETLVLPGHRRPFYGLQQRCRELIAHHAERCRIVVDACHNGPKTVTEIVPILFPIELDPHQFGFAFAETHAHVNRVVAEGTLVWREQDGVWVVGERS